MTDSVSFQDYSRGLWRTVTVRSGAERVIVTDKRGSNGATEEPWSWSRDSRFSLDEGYVYQERRESGSGVDGGWDSHKFLRCRVDELKSHRMPDGTLSPNWQDVPRGRGR